MAFYKYREFSEKHLNALAENKLWFARGATFNDPFDGEPPVNILTYESMAKFLRKRPLSSQLTETQFSDIVIKQLDEARILIKEGRFHEHAIYPFFYLIAAKVLRSFILCLSQTNTNVLMWSPYSKGHTGFCVQYNLDVLLNEMNVSRHNDVVYSNMLPDVLSSLIDDEGTDLSKDILFQKAEDWGYEQEYRLILDELSENENDKDLSVEYSDDAIEKIYFGLKVEEKDKQNLLDILSGKQVEFYEMQRTSSSIGVYAKKI